MVYKPAYNMGAPSCNHMIVIIRDDKIGTNWLVCKSRTASQPSNQCEAHFQQSHEPYCSKQWKMGLEVISWSVQRVHWLNHEKNNHQAPSSTTGKSWKSHHENHPH